MNKLLKYRILPYSRYGSLYQERESYYRSFITEYDLDFTHHVLTEEHQAPFVTKTLISPQDIPFGATPRVVISKTGTPSFEVRDSNDLKDHKILFYHIRLLQEKVLIQFHFIEDFFYYCQLSFLAFTGKTNELLADSIRAKYGYPGNIARQDQVVIRDTCDNKIVIEQGVYLTVRYVTGDRYPREVLETQIRHNYELAKKTDKEEIIRLSRIL